MTATAEITKRLDGFKESGLIADYELIVLDDSIRVRVVAARNESPDDVKAFIVDALAGRLSESQISVDATPI